jgi:hypothetical protein
MGLDAVAAYNAGKVEEEKKKQEEEEAKKRVPPAPPQRQSRTSGWNADPQNPTIAEAYTYPVAAIAAMKDLPFMQSKWVTAGRKGAENFDSRSDLRRAADRQLGGYGDWKKVQQTPENKETERMARLADVINNQWAVTTGTQMGNMGQEGSVVHLGPAQEGGIVRHPGYANEDTRLQEQLRAAEAARREWNSGRGQQMTKFENDAALMKNAEAAMNNLATQYSALDLQEDLVNMNIDQESAAQIVRGWNDLKMEAEEWNRDFYQNREKYNAGLDIQKKLQAARHILANKESYMGMFMMLSMMNGSGLSVPTAFNQMISTPIHNMRVESGSFPDLKTETRGSR